VLQCMQRRGHSLLFRAMRCWDVPVSHVCLEFRTRLGLLDLGSVQTYEGDRMLLLPCLSVKRATGMHMLGHLPHFRFIIASNPGAAQTLAASMLRAR